MANPKIDYDYKKMKEEEMRSHEKEGVRQHFQETTESLCLIVETVLDTIPVEAKARIIAKAGSLFRELGTEALSNAMLAIDQACKDTGWNREEALILISGVRQSASLVKKGKQ